MAKRHSVVGRARLKGRGWAKGQPVAAASADPLGELLKAATVAQLSWLHDKHWVETCKVISQNPIKGCQLPCYTKRSIQPSVFSLAASSTGTNGKGPVDRGMPSLGHDVVL